PSMADRPTTPIAYPAGPRGSISSHLPPVVQPGHTMASVTEKISAVVLTQHTPRGWYIGLAISLAQTVVLFISVTHLLVKGVDIWGIIVPVAWGIAIINFVWWIGIGHAGTLISAILLLFRQD